MRDVFTAEIAETAEGAEMKRVARGASLASSIRVQNDLCALRVLRGEMVNAIWRARGDTD